MASPTSLDRAQHTSVVTLIHGTWGRGALLPWRRQARWTEASLLATALRNHGGEVNVANWSGRNSFRGRKGGSSKIAAQLREKYSSTPGAAHFLIAHSHGGTIALLATRDEEVRRGLCGIVCLATPFPFVRLRALWEESSTTIWRRIAFPLVFTVLFAPALLIAIGSGSSDTIASVLIFGFLGASALAAFVWLLTLWGPGLLVGRRLVERIQKAGLAFVEQHRLEQTAQVPVLVVRAPADEASGILITSHFASWLSRRVKRASMLTFALGVVAIIVFGMFGFGDSAAASFLALLLIGPGVIVWLALPLMWMLSLATACAFGLDVLWRSVMVQVSAEPAPPGQCELLQVDRSPSRGLSHAIYDNPLVVDDIMAWMNKRLHSQTLVRSTVEDRPIGTVHVDTMPTPAAPASKARSGLRLALHIVWALGALVIVVSGIATWLFLGSEHGQKLIDVAREGIGLALESTQAPGTDALRAAGCGEAMVMSTSRMFGLAERIAPGARQNAATPRVDETLVMCQVTTADDVGPSCPEVARIYAREVPDAPERFSVVVQRQSGQARCGGSYGRDGSFLRSLERK